ncbi:MAG: ribonucleoside-diphosphate reductase subunit alpha, partial [Candidatus Aenigmatarchaeota archaeon]
DLAKRNLKYSSEEGKRYIHYLAERHAYYMLKASLRLGKEKGNCDWIHKTKWPDGWTFKDGWINLDKSLLRFELKYDWDQLSMEVKENKGIRNSCLIAYMPTESSSKATGLPNGIYPIRDIYLKKTDASNHVDFVVKESDILKDQYELAWDIDVKDMAEVYGIIQKFTDQSISADFYIDRSKEEELKTSRLMDEFMYFYKYGLKTRYYTNSRTTKSIKLEDLNNKGCSSGFCTL